KGDLLLGADFLERAIEEATALDAQDLVAVPLMMLGGVRVVQGRWREASSYELQAAPLLERTGDWKHWFQAIGVHSVSLTARGRYNEALREVEELLPVALEIQHPTAFLLSYIYIFYAHYFAGNFL